MRILVAHNHYQYRGGEDAVVESEVSLLRRHGHEVHTYTRHNDDIDGRARWRVAGDTVWSRRTASDLRRLVADFRPDVVHVHNSFPLISPSIHWTAGAAGVATVQTVHNFRNQCPQGVFLRDGRICEDCLGNLPWRAVVHGCYRGSRAESAASVVNISVHRALGTWRDRVDRYIALSGFCRDKLVQGGLPAARIDVKPNFCDEPAPDATPSPGRPREGFLYVGRLSVEKGVEVPRDAVRRLQGRVTVDVVGTGPMADDLAGTPGLRLHGALDGAEVRRRMAAARALVLPSTCYESFPRVIAEAFSVGLPAICSGLGTLTELAGEGRGWTVAPGSAEELATALATVAADPTDAAARGERALRHYREQLTPQRNAAMLEAVYARAVGAAQARQRAA